jgi:mitogen-activated protein kinase 1/3
MTFSNEAKLVNKRSRTKEIQTDNSLDDLYLVFEYVDTDLNRLLGSAQYLSPAHIQTFLYQLLVGLKYIHSANVIHRDIKPANILLFEDCTLKICDFGLSRVMNTPAAEKTSRNVVNDSHSALSSVAMSARSGDSPDSPTTSPPGVTRQLTHHVVTRWYRAPELILLRPYTNAVDMWSVGCVLGELLGMQAESVRDYQDRSPLFPGSSCRTLSTDGKPRPENFFSKKSSAMYGENRTVDNDMTTFDPSDQLCIILEIIGSPSEEDIAAIGDIDTEEFLRSIPNYKSKVSISRNFKLQSLTYVIVVEFSEIIPRGTSRCS